MKNIILYIILALNFIILAGCTTIQSKPNLNIESTIQQLEYKQFLSLCNEIAIPEEMLNKIETNDKLSLFCDNNICQTDNSFHVLFEQQLIEKLISKNKYILERNTKSLNNLALEWNVDLYSIKKDTLDFSNLIAPKLQNADKILSYSFYNGGKLIDLSNEKNIKRYIYLDIRFKLTDVKTGRILSTKSVEFFNHKNMNSVDLTNTELIELSNFNAPYNNKNNTRLNNQQTPTEGKRSWFEKIEKK